MIPFAVLRHARTSWNEQHRMQGRADSPLSASGQASLVGKTLPLPFAGYEILSSPLERCLATARALGITAPRVEARLIETDWGTYEGRTLAELRIERGEELAVNESRGLDFRAPGGKSPREVRTRLATLLVERAAEAAPTTAFTHRGVIRALLSLALDWNMLGEQPVHLDWECLHLFNLDGDGRPRLEQANIPLALLVPS